MEFTRIEYGRGTKEGMKVKLIAQFHPAAALHNPRLWAEMLGDWQNMPEQVPHDYIIHQAKDINFTGMPVIAVDTETDNKGGIGQWSAAYRDGEGRLTVAPFYGSRPDIRFNCPVVMHNAKYDIRELKTNKMTPPEQFHDTMGGLLFGFGETSAEG